MIDMKRIIYILCMITALGFTSCSKDNDSDPTVKPTQTGKMTDKEGNEYQWVRIGKLDWMAENLKCGTPYYDWEGTDRGDTGYLVSINDRAASTKQFGLFGNYYSYDDAVADAPTGWRLPTDEDWKVLEKELGMSDGAANELGWRDGAANLMLQTLENGTGLNFRYGGELCKWGSPSILKESHVYEFGLYWSSTIDESISEKAVYFRRIMPYRNQIERNSCTVANRYLSVRYVRDAQ